MLIILCFCCDFFCALAELAVTCGERAKASQRQKDAGQEDEQAN